MEGIELVANGVERVDGDSFSREQAGELLLEADQDLADIIGRMDPVGDMLEVFIEGEALFELPDLVRLAVYLVWDIAPPCT
jgi:hypothetical protein